MAAAEWLEVEVLYALPHRQKLLALRVPAGATALDAVRDSGLLAAYPELQQTLTLAVFGRLVEPGQLLKNGDRVELLRQLLADPKDQRRARLREARKARLKR